MTGIHGSGGSTCTVQDTCTVACKCTAVDIYKVQVVYMYYVHKTLGQCIKRERERETIIIIIISIAGCVYVVCVCVIVEYVCVYACVSSSCLLIACASID